ncbi:type IV secretion system protein [Steroidobacter sp. S1-65]|uniref:Type IV secretion system protein n=1 Tax=Steroidobacter gossypii TaxID=2805490 RepID=A0ABS1X6M1_9GAMM|nr:type IV secretion system protein [Steroidobacter gossypii]MBM0108868.1 type IV secretion system protein [Steroidobacter gossypii]
MKANRWMGLLGMVALLAGFVPTANAQWAVVDVGAITQLIEQVRTMQEQLSTARNQLAQAEAEYRSMTGGRGMERLLSDVPRNYLPGEWREVLEVMTQTSVRYGAIAREMQRLVEDNSVLTADDLGSLSPTDRRLIESSRRSRAMLQIMTREALGRTSDRFGSIQQLIDAIGRADDQKAVLDLQARIQAENNMLMNENTKLLVMFQLAQAEENAHKLRMREEAMIAFGSLRDLPPIGL